MTHINCSTRTFALAFAALGILFAGTGCQVASPAREQAVTQDRTSGPGAVFAVSRSLPLSPDPKLTPGAVLPVTRDDICVPGYAHKVRHVPESVKRQAYAEYGITTHKAGDFEVDHLISLELGGSNSLKNLWPESYKTQPWNAHVKDVLENRLHADVCSNQISLTTAQQEISQDWVGNYKRIFHTNKPLAHAPGGQRRSRGEAAYDSVPEEDTSPAAPVSSAAPVSPSVTGTGTGNGQVWVNTHSHKYFRPGSPYYGKTKAGAYMTEQDALKGGNVAAK